MVPADLRAYPRLLALHSDIGQPALAGLPIAELFDGELGRYQLEEVENALEALAVRPATDVAEQKGKLFVAGWGHWDSTRLELLALSTLQGDGSLEATGWPATGYGGSPPFDGVIRDVHGQQASIAFDVKSAFGSGIGLLQERLQTVATAWSVQQQLGPVDVRIGAVGTIPTREVVGPEIGRMLVGMRDALRQKTRLPASYTHAMPEGGTVTATVDDADVISVNTVVGPINDRKQSAVTVMRDHICNKARHAQQNGRAFVLIYVRPAGAGAGDAGRDAIVAAAKELDLAAESDWWLGSLLIDFSGTDIVRHGHLRANGRWPNGSSGRTLNQTLRL